MEQFHDGPAWVFFLFFLLTVLIGYPISTAFGLEKPWEKGSDHAVFFYSLIMLATVFFVLGWISLITGL